MIPPPPPPAIERSIVREGDFLLECDRIDRDGGRTLASGSIRLTHDSGLSATADELKYVTSDWEELQLTGRIAVDYPLLGHLEVGDSLQIQRHLGEFISLSAVGPIFLTGGGREIRAEHLSIDHQKGIATFEGNVRYTDPLGTADATTFALTYSLPPRLIEAILIGEVKISTDGDQVITADQVEYNPAEEVMTLSAFGSGKVTFFDPDHKRKVTAPKVVIERKGKIIRGVGAVRFQGNIGEGFGF